MKILSDKRFDKLSVTSELKIKLESRMTKERKNCSKCWRHTWGDSDYCLFHKPKKTHSEATLFWDVINYPNYKSLIENLFTSGFEFKHYEKRILSTGFVSAETYKMTNMSGFIFPKKNQNSNKIIFESFNFSYPSLDPLSLHLRFNNAIFECPVSFNNYQFLGSVSFIGTEFKQGFTFKNASFHINVEFKNVKGRISDVNFPFKNAKAIGYYFVIEDDKIPYFDLNEIEFGRDVDFQLKIKKTKDDSGFGEPLYRIAKKQATDNGNYAKASEYHYWERYYRDIEKSGLKVLFTKNFYRTSKDARRNTLSEIKQKLKGTFSRKLVGYGAKPWKALIWGAFIIPVFAFIYLFTGLSIYHHDSSTGLTKNIILQYSIDISQFTQNLNYSFQKQFWNDYLESLFYSASSFSTASFGSIPLGGASQFFTTLEMALGIILFGVFTATYLNKLLK